MKKLINAILVRTATRLRQLGLKRLPYWLMHLNMWVQTSGRWKDIRIERFDLVPDDGQKARCTVTFNEDMLVHADPEDADEGP